MPGPMGEPRFIDPPMSLALDVVRALAALMVLVGHSVQLGLYTGPYPFSAHAQHNAVVVFFVLSGLVIATSVRARNSSLKEYAAARVLRIVPLAIFAVVLSSVISILWSGSSAPAIIQPASYSHLTPASVVLPLLFLSESPLGTGPAWNPPFWSLCYEVWYYAIFGAAFYLKGVRRIAWIILLAVVAGPRILLLLPLWLIGTGLAKLSFRPSPLTGALLIVGSCAVLAGVSVHAITIREHLFQISRIDPEAFRFSEFFITDTASGLAVAIGFVGLRPLAQLGAAALARCGGIIRSAAGSSFAVYLVHWPLLCLLQIMGITAGRNALAFAAILFLVIAPCFVLGLIFDRLRQVLPCRFAAWPRPNDRPAMPASGHAAPGRDVSATCS